MGFLESLFLLGSEIAFSDVCIIGRIVTCWCFHLTQLCELFKWGSEFLVCVGCLKAESLLGILFSHICNFAVWRVRVSDEISFILGGLILSLTLL